VKILKDPLVHFLVVGCLLFAGYSWLHRGSSQPPDSRRIEITAGTIAWLREGFDRQWHRSPDADELRGLVNDYLREEVLYREALAMGLDRDDTIVRRRLAQKIEFLSQDVAAAVVPNDAALRKFFEDNAERYAKAARISFRHVYFSRERRGTKVEADAREALDALAKGVNEETVGDPFLREYEFTEANVDDITAALGREFAAQVMTLPEGEWRGPVASSYGVHLVWVSERAAPQPVAFEAVRDTVLRDFNEARRREVNREFIERLRQRYQISVDEVALAGAAAPTTKTATR
jgi:parvulin-like peptidyl-prolyl isomerase